MPNNILINRFMSIYIYIIVLNLQTSKSQSTKAKTMKLSGLPLLAALFLVVAFTLSPIRVSVNGNQLFLFIRFMLTTMGIKYMPM